MDENVRWLQRVVALQEASLRLQKFAIVLAAESVAYQSAAASGTTSRAAIDRLVVRAVKSMRRTVERVAAGRALPE